MSFGQRAEIHRILTDSEEWGALALWRQGYDTYAIAIKLGVHECEIANRLMRLRQQEKGQGQCQIQAV